MAFSEFYMTSGGSQLNAGSTTSNGSVYTSASGNWVQATRVFTPTDNQTTSSLVAVGDFASVYLNAATVGVYIGRVTNVGAGVNGTITIDATAIYGSAPSNSTGGITVKTGGAWLGPNGAATFPFGLSGTIGALKNVATDQVRVNVKNDQTYTMTAALPFATLGNAVMQGYTGSVGDLGKATFTSNVTAATNFTQAGNVNCAFVDLIFASTAASGNSNLFLSTPTSLDTVFIRCVFHGARNSGYASASGGAANVYMIECEAYDNGKANAANQAGIANANSASGCVFCYNCYSHDNAGSNSNGFSITTACGMVLVNCISETNGNCGLFTATGAGGVVCINCNFYNNTSDGVRLGYTAANCWTVLINNNFLLNAKGVNATTASQGGILYNNGRGAGTQANTGADVLKSIVDTGTDVTYASNVTPWTAPTTGNFTTNLLAAMFVGRGVFTETDGTNTGTVGKPDIGASQAGPVQTGFTFGH